MPGRRAGSPIAVYARVQCRDPYRAWRFNSTVKTIYSYYLPIIYLCSHALLCDLFTCVYCTQCTVFMKCSKISIPVLCTCLLGPLSPTPLWFVFWCIQCVLYCCVPVCQVLCLPLLYNLFTGVYSVYCTVVYLSARSSVSHSSMIYLLVCTVCAVLLYTCLPGPLSPTPLWFVYLCVQCVLYYCVPVCQVLCLPLLYDGEAWSPNLSVETTRDAARTFLEKDITKRCYCHDLCIVLSIISAFNIPVKKFIFLMNTKLCWTNNAVSWGPFPYTWGY